MVYKNKELIRINTIRFDCPQSGFYRELRKGEFQENLGVESWREL